MTNDTNTLNGALTELGENMADNLVAMGVSGASASDGLTTLSGKILDIAPSVGGITPVVTIDISKTPSGTITSGDTVIIECKVNADYDDESVADIDLHGYLQGATLTIKNSGTTLGTAVSDSTGVATYTISNIQEGNYSITAHFDGTGTDYESATSTALTFTVQADLTIYYDQATESNLANYTQSEAGVFTWDSTNQAYNGYKYEDGFPSISMTLPNNLPSSWKLTTKVYALSGQSNIQPAIIIGNFLIRAVNNDHILAISNMSYTNYATSSLQFKVNEWLTFEITYQNGTLTAKIYDASSTLLSTVSYNTSLTTDTFKLATGYTRATIKFKEIKIQSL